MVSHEWTSLEIVSWLTDIVGRSQSEALYEVDKFISRLCRDCLTLISSPDEYPFTTGLPAPVIPPLTFPAILYPNNVNANASIQSFYTRSIVPRICRQATLALAAKKRASGIIGDDEYEDDGNYGSAATVDVEILQAISKRVHYGMYPASFILEPNAYEFVQ